MNNKWNNVLLALMVAMVLAFVGWGIWAIFTPTQATHKGEHYTYYLPMVTKAPEKNINSMRPRYPEAEEEVYVPIVLPQEPTPGEPPVVIDPEPNPVDPTPTCDDCGQQQWQVSGPHPSPYEGCGFQYGEDNGNATPMPNPPAYQYQYNGK